MKKLPTLLTLALLLSLVLVGSVGVGAASATHSEGEGPDYDFVRGTATTVGGAKFHVNAKSGASGEDPTGHFFVERKNPPSGLAAFDFRGEVTCLRVDGNRALVGGRVTQTKGDFPANPPEGSGFLIRILDNGEPGDADFVNGIPVPGGGVPDVCPNQTTTNPIQRGNFIVHDATA
jgi:hypothetical protein